MTMKRRIVYLSDEQWETLQRQARGEETTISALIRSRMALVPMGTGVADVEFHYRPKAEIARTFTPVPKPSKRR